MPLLRITRQYNNGSPLRGFIESSLVPFNSKEDGHAWVNAVARNPNLTWDLIDYEWALIISGNPDRSDIEVKT